MAAPRPLEHDLTKEAEDLLARFSGEYVIKYSLNRFEARMLLLEAVSSRFGGFDYLEYQNEFNKSCAKHVLADILNKSEKLVSLITTIPIPPQIILSILSRENLIENDRKLTGAYHTDFRLAKRIANQCISNNKVNPTSKVIDPACGTGILLVALTIEICGKDRNIANSWLQNSIYACDLSSNSLRGALLSLAAFTNDLCILKIMRGHWFCGDSLIQNDLFWNNFNKDGFDAVIGNPPWEKIKITKHEFLKSSGIKRHYGQSTEAFIGDEFREKQNAIAKYNKKLLTRYPSLGFGEPDLYIAFTELFFRICRKGGVIVAILPGGFIRSQGSSYVRNKLISESEDVKVSVIDNKAKFFEIDSRFKFLIISLQKKYDSIDYSKQNLHLTHEKGNLIGLETLGNVHIGRKALANIRPDFSIPEVKNITEWRLFLSLYDSGIKWDDKQSGWNVKFSREVDMTKDKINFQKTFTSNHIPVIEGRMVSQYRFGCKGYISGSGRSALWESYPIGNSLISPQFWIAKSKLSSLTHERIKSKRVGFCDISGQTNERTFMAALIPENVVCGNKVPTILFDNDNNNECLYVWLAITNSFVFDWAIRRILTTTVNYFLLQSIPFPRIIRGGLPWHSLLEKAQEISSLDNVGYSYENLLRISYLRAEIDAEIAIAYGLCIEDMEVIMSDFPLLDRGQTPLKGEKKSTITRDLILATLARKLGFNSTTWQARKDEATSSGAVAYISSQAIFKEGSIVTKKVVNND
ncbi:N-6 DNA methylase [Salmonella enterica]|uniref:Eco57I restriction-modification methylase domain-containing protein n=1 Tax=Enterobacter ludwigii TaxID=299767 RepID=UPI001287944A|nr:restriction endonuclease [Salmonella enterica]EBZ9486887.1 restriction endonuclease [Salmonella enterica subsp. enterica serovar Newport]EHB9745637.1 N-6 DNA methylase [Salmonella enterica subsp. enterica serovar Enteritidis]EBH3045644.1 restriction endonuclease [Salmonella enterica]ECF7786517.1 N-6 DNA methylase [Salmonella enterica]